MTSTTRETQLHEARDLVHSWIEAGVHQQQIKGRLRTLGLPTFRYEERRHQGARESARRRRQGRLCEALCGRRRSGVSDLCSRCLSAKWAG